MKLLWSVVGVVLVLAVPTVGQQRGPIMIRPTQPATGKQLVAGRRATMQDLNLQIAKIPGGVRALPSMQISNPAIMSNPILNTLRMQKQSADLEAGQIMSARTGTGMNAGSPGIRMATSAPMAIGGGRTNNLGVLPANATGICMGNMTGIKAVNQKKTGVIFTPDPTYNLYTITGCGFGMMQGKLYLQGGPGVFPAHSGKLNFKVRTWSDRAIVAELDPSISGELDQNNVNLVVETSTGGHAQAPGFSFYAMRGRPVPLTHIAPSDFCWNGGTNSSMCVGGYLGYIEDGEFLSPCGNNCSVWIFIEPPIATIAVHRIDRFTPKLKPGFVLSSVVAQIYANIDNPEVVSAYKASFSGDNVLINEPVSHYGAGNLYFTMYSVQFYAVGPIGVSDPVAD